MNQIITGRAAGVRRITPAMVQAQRAAEMQPMSDAAPKDILSVLRRARSAIGLTCQQTELLAFLVSWIRPQDWGDDGLPICAARNADIMERFDLGRTRVKELIRSLAEGGWLICNDSPNGHRFVRRAGRSGPVTHGYGFDLSPLSRRYAELEAAALAQEERRREGRRLHSDIMMLARRALALCATEMKRAFPRDALRPTSRKPATFWHSEAAIATSPFSHRLQRGFSSSSSVWKPRFLPFFLWKVTPRGRPSVPLLLLQTQTI
ncbi:helix-turn-helix domain-containing protein [Acetobacter sicerae]|uniref:helix-turn-helix domain-containing protein n=1 Tax=Acetobacter sicerae TaxID=85325 RepID=UPI001F54966D|nr:helix-turn-helix domain-containing protein [Acetobacter sicerae]